MAMAYSELGVIYLRQGKVELGIDWIQRVIEMYELALKDEKQASNVSQRSLAEQYVGLAATYVKQNQFIAAREAAEKRLELRLETVNENHPRLWSTTTYWGSRVLNCRNISRRASYLKGVVDQDRAAIRSQNIAATRVSLAKALKGKGNYSASREQWGKVVAIRAAGPDEQLLGIAHNNFGMALLREKKFAEAFESLEKGLAIQEKILKSDDPVLAVIYLNMTSALFDLQRLDEATVFVNKAIGILKLQPEPDQQKLKTA